MNNNTNLLLHLTGSVVYGYFGYALHTRVGQIENIYNKQFNHIFSEIGKLRTQLNVQEAENTRLKRHIRKLNKMFWAYNVGDAEVVADESATSGALVAPDPLALEADIGYDSDPEIQDTSEVAEEVEYSEMRTATPVTEPAELQTIPEPIQETLTEPIPDPIQENTQEPEEVSSPIELISEQTAETPITNVVSVVIPPIIKGDKIWNPASSRYILRDSKLGKILHSNYLTQLEATN